MSTASIPGYWPDAKGNLIPEAKIKPIDKVQHELVNRLCKMAQDQSAVLASFKRITADELAAKQLIDNCVHRWAAGANDNIRALVNHAFQTDKTGQINTARVLALRQLDIKDDEWLRAMQAIADSIQTLSSKPYVRFYERNDTTGEYLPISLNVAAV